MYKKIASYFSLAIILMFVVYMVYDTIISRSNTELINDKDFKAENLPAWDITGTLEIPFGNLKSICLSEDRIFLGGMNYLTALNKKDLAVVWNIPTEEGVYALAYFENRIYAATYETISIFDTNGNFIEEWGSYDEEALITSIAANENYVVFADANNKMIYVLNKEGALKYFFGQPGNQFVVPSAYFDIAFYNGDTLLVANPGKQRLEYRTVNGDIISMIGEAGFDLKDFCGCCNPSHFALFPNGQILTAEKGLNRLKVISAEGNLIELVAQPSFFKPIFPLDVAVSEEGIIYASNGADSKLYIFKRKE
ncbi:MAG: hypothetical protein V1783_03940 [Bacteroidota bacterium]